jgi:hypothetical protein
MKLVLSLLVLFHSLTVLAAASHHFVFEDVEDNPELFVYRDNINKELDKIHAQDSALAVSIKGFLEILQKVYLAGSRTSEIEERERLDVAFEIMREHLRPKLLSFQITWSNFFIDFERMNDQYLRHTKDEGTVDFSPLITLFDGLIKQCKSEFTKEQLDIMDLQIRFASQFNIFKLVIFQYLMTLKKDQVFKLVFQGKIPMSFTGKSLDEAIENLPELLENISRRKLRPLKCRISFFSSGSTDEQLSEDEDVKIFESALNILMKHALPLVKNRTWLYVPSEDKHSEGNSNNNGSNDPELVSTSVPKFFEFDDLKDIKDGASVDKSKLLADVKRINEKLSGIAQKNLKLAVEVKRFLDFMLNCFISFQRSRDIYEIVKLEIAYETIAAFLQLKLGSFDMDESFFIDLYSMFFKYEVLSRKGYHQVRHTAPGDFVRDIIQKNQTQFTAKKFEAISKESPEFYYDLYQYLIFQYLMSLDKDQFIKLIFYDKFPQSSEKLLCPSNEDFDLTLKNTSKNLLDNLKEHFSHFDFQGKIEFFDTALPKLYKIALPEIKNFYWLYIPPVSSKPNPDGSKNQHNLGGHNNNNQGLFGEREKIFAICTIVVIVALLGGGFAFWHLRLRNKNQIAPSA